MLRRRFLALVLVTSLLVGCTSKITVVKIPGNVPAPADGVIYALPNTVVRILVKVDKVERSMAPYAMFAAIFAPNQKPVCNDEYCTEESKNKYSLQQGAAFTTYGEPDPSNVFLVKFTGGGTIDQNLSMTWNEAGLLATTASSVTNRTGDIVLSSLKLLSGLGTKAVLGAAEATTEVTTCEKDRSPADSWVIKIINDNSRLDTKATLIANYCAIKKEERQKFIDIPKYRQLLADAVVDYENLVAPLVRGRTKLLAGETTVLDPLALLARNEVEIKEHLTALYLGSKKTATWEGVLDVRALKADTLIPVLRIDPEKGICLVNSEVPPDAKPIPAEFKIQDSQACAKATPINLTLSYYPESSKQLFAKITDITIGDRSFRYRIPAQMKASLHDNKNTYGSGVFSVAQFGTLVSLPASRQSKTLTFELAFIEATGGLKTFKLGTAGGLDNSTIDALAGVGSTLVEARNTSRKNADELTVLTREYTLLKLRDDICAIQKKYGLPCTVQPQ